MAIETLTFARIKVLTYIFCDAAKAGYLDYLTGKESAERLGNDYDDPRVAEFQRRQAIGSFQTIVFAAMCFEAAIYDYAAVRLGESYAKKLDRESAISRWERGIPEISGSELDKSRAPYRALKRLVDVRNSLVHHKSEPLHGPTAEEQFAKVMVEDKEFENEVDNAFRALVLMSFELERITGVPGWPLPSFDPNILEPQEHPLRSIIEDCRRTVFGQSQNAELGSK